MTYCKMNHECLQLIVKNKVENNYNHVIKLQNLILKYEENKIEMKLIFKRTKQYKYANKLNKIFKSVNIYICKYIIIIGNAELK